MNYKHRQNKRYVWTNNGGPTNKICNRETILEQSHYENMPFKYTENFTTKKWKFSDKQFFIFLLKKNDCGYSLEPPWRGGSYEYPKSMFLSINKKNNVYPCKPQFTIKKKWDLWGGGGGGGGGGGVKTI